MTTATVRFATGLFLAAFMACSPAILLGGEKIRFSEPGQEKAADAPSEPPRGLKRGADHTPNFSNPLGRSVGAPVPLPPRPQSRQAVPMDELLNRERSWIIPSENSSQEDVLKKIFSVRDFGPAAQERKPRGFDDLSPDNSDDQKSSSPSSDPFSLDPAERDERGFGSRQTDPGHSGSDSTTSPSMNPVAGGGSGIESSLQSPFNPASTQAGIEWTHRFGGLDSDRFSQVQPDREQLIRPRLDGLFGQSPRDNNNLRGNDTLSRQERRAQDIQDLLRPRNEFSPGNVSGAINFSGPAFESRETSSFLQGWGDENRQTSSENQFGFSTDPAFNSPDRSRVRDPFQTRDLGSSSLSPSVPAPSSSPAIQPRPVILEIPRRRF